MSRKLEIELERKIVKAAIEGLLAAGYSVAVDNGGDEYEFGPSTDAEAIYAATFLADEDTLIAFKAGKRIGWAWFIYGNVADVLSDYTVNLEEALKPATELAEKYS